MDIRNFEYRIYPSQKHIKRLKAQFSLAREMHNILLLLQKDTYSATGKGMSRNDMNRAITRLKEMDPRFKEVHSQVLQNISDRISKAFKAFFKRVEERRRGRPVKAGYPRPKAWTRSVIYPQSGFKLVTKRRLYISKVGNVPVVLHRPLPTNYKVKTMTVKRTRADKWFVVMCCEIRDIGEEGMEGVAGEEDGAEGTQKSRPPHPFRDRHIGIDVGLESYAVDSDGGIIENPRYLVRSERRLKRLQRRVSSKVKGSRNRRKARLRLARLHEKVSDQRKDFLHKESRRLAERYGLLGVEDLSIKDMMRNAYLSKHISDASWGMFLRMIGYKAESANALFVAVDPRGTTNECSECGANIHKELSDRVHRCQECGLELPRDHNAARVILMRAEHTVGLTGIYACGENASTGRSGLAEMSVSDRPASGLEETGTIYDRGPM